MTAKKARGTSAIKEIPELLAKVINAKPEEDELICELANREKAAFIAFVAPYVGVRISPVEQTYATISLPEEFGVEAVVGELASAGVKKAYLLVNSPGGAMTSSYKISRAIRAGLDEIITFVPHIAASGGTLLALIGNQIVMGPMSHISPLDVQIPYKGTRISAANFKRFFTRSSEWFERITPEEAPYPQRALADKLDPFIMEEWSGLLVTQTDYVEEILRMAGYDESLKIAMRLVQGFPAHGYVITQEKAKEIGLEVRDSSEFREIWSAMRYWLGKYMLEEEVTHCIRYAIPGSKDDEGEKND